MKDRTLKAAIVACIVLLSAGIILTISLTQVPPLQWAIEEGDAYTFSINVTGFKRFSYNDPDNGSLIRVIRPPPYAELNKTEVTVEVASLPDLSSNMDADSFALQVIEHLKTNLIAPLVYENGTESPHQPYDFLNSLVSQCLLPVGDWSFLDSLYDDDADLVYCNTYLSRMEENWFLIGHKYYLIDAGNGWHGLVSKDTGVPSTATLWANKYYSDWCSYTITLTLMD